MPSMRGLEGRLCLARCNFVVVVVMLAACLCEGARTGRSLQEGGVEGAKLLADMRQLRSQNKVYMAPVEQALIEQYLEPGQSMVEWGSGWSTLWMSQVRLSALP